MTFIKTLRKELKAVLRAKDVIIMLAIGPIALTIMIGGTYLHTYVEDIPVAIVDEDHSSLSRMIAEQFDENQRFTVQTYVDSAEELKELVETNKVSVGVYIPAHFSDDVIKGTSSQVLVIVDGTNMVTGNSSYAAATSIIQTIAAGAEIKRISARGVIGQDAMNMANPFMFNDRMLYNPNLAYINYLLFGYIALFLQSVVFSAVGIRMIAEGKQIAAHFMIKETLIKILSCAFYAIISVSLAILVANIIFHVRIRGSIFLSLLFCTEYALAISAPAIIVAAIVKDKLKHVQLSYMLSLPTFICCGYIWPLAQMPKIMVVLIKCFWPLVYFAKPFDELLFKGTLPTESMLNLAIYIAVWLPISMLFFKFRYRTKRRVETVTEILS